MPLMKMSFFFSQDSRAAMFSSYKTNKAGGRSRTEGLFVRCRGGELEKKAAQVYCYVLLCSRTAVRFVCDHLTYEVLRLQSFAPLVFTKFAKKLNQYSIIFVIFTFFTSELYSP